MGYLCVYITVGCVFQEDNNSALSFIRPIFHKVVIKKARDRLAGLVSVTRVRPRTSKGITDLLLPQTSIG